MDDLPILMDSTGAVPSAISKEDMSVILCKPAVAHPPVERRLWPMTGPLVMIAATSGGISAIVVVSLL